MSTSNRSPQGGDAVGVGAGVGVLVPCTSTISSGSSGSGSGRSSSSGPDLFALSFNGLSCNRQTDNVIVFDDLLAMLHGCRHTSNLAHGR